MKRRCSGKGRAMLPITERSVSFAGPEAAVDAYLRRRQKQAMLTFEQYDG
ncbi:MAG TPA: hypothetical protein VGE06_05800 [Flavisolibacter sp.]